ncbi:MAG: hypothetical protein LUG16_07430 [Candidatus Gastranaerophilales bacterium]|nr:hypothetical protein [Candidatus Gastranaerophilales bacterium]
MKKYFKLVLFLILFSSPVFAVDSVYLSRETSQVQNTHKKETGNNITSQKGYVKTSVPSEVRLVCTVNNKTRQKTNKIKQKANASGLVYTFILRDNQIYDIENKLIKTSEVNENVLKFTYKFKQNFTYETTRFTIDRYTGTFKAYRKFSSFDGHLNELTSGVCTVNNNASRMF